LRPHAAIDDGFFAWVRGVEQWITLRGADVGNPVLLILPGPGGAFSRLAAFFAAWEADFTLVQWDQPGGGATYARNGEMALTLDRLAADAAAVAEIAAFDAWALGLRFETPMLFLQGEHDLHTPTAEVAACAAALSAPDVRLETIAGGGHSAVFLREAFLARLREIQTIV